MAATPQERLAQKEAQLKKVKTRIAKDQALAAKLQKEITELESFEITAMVKELHLPFGEVRSMLEEIKQRRS